MWRAGHADPLYVTRVCGGSRAGRFDTEAEARRACAEMMTDVTGPARLCSGIIEFAASDEVEPLALEPDAAEFPHGVINRPCGVLLDRRSNKWKAVIHVQLERVHLGAFDADRVHAYA